VTPFDSGTDHGCIGPGVCGVQIFTPVKKENMITLEDKISQWEKVKAEAEPGGYSWTYADGVICGLTDAIRIVEDLERQRKAIERARG